ncbi:M1 family metallopeptidase [Mariniradius saccharolyticus]|nr:M1 family metallopeptidase [Mariniradius saccharolyticus]
MACKTSQTEVSSTNDSSMVVVDSLAQQQPMESDEQIIRRLESEISEYRASRTRDFDLLHTALDLRFDYGNETVVGEAVLTLKPYFFPQKTVVLDAKDFEIHAFGLLEEGRSTELNFYYNERKVTAYLPKSYSANDTIQVRIKYTAFPNKNTTAAGSAITDTKGIYFVNPQSKPGKPTQIWTQGETEYNSKWFPTIDSPNERATQEIKMTVDSKYRTLSNGKLLSSKENGDGTRTDHWKLDLAHAPYLAAIAVGDFVEIKDSWDGMPVNYYVEPEFEKGGKIVFQNTPEMIAYFSSLLGVPYPWSHYNQVVVRDFVTGAMENTTLTIFMEELNLNEREAIDSEWDGIIAHELFHQWFGDYVTTESWANLTLNEAFATYSEYLWYEYKNGRDEADLHHVSEIETYLDEAEVKQEDLIRFYHDKPDDMFDSHSYAKGGAILHMLRRHLGDEAFFKSLNHYLKKHAFQSVEVHDLRIAFEEVTGLDLNWFFNQWFLASGHPILEYEVDYSQEDNLLLTVSQRQDFSTTPLYRIPFKVSWYVNGERREKELVIDKAWQQFAIENGEPVDLLMVDEAVDLLAVKKTSRGKQHFINQFQASTLGIARYEALDSLKSMFASDEGVREIVAAALKDSFWSIREMALIGIAENPNWLLEIEGLEETIYQMAENDPKNTVRLGAIELLSVMDADKYANDFLRWINHPSYYVAGAALSAYLENENNVNREEIAGRFENEKNIRMLVALAGYYLSEETAGKSVWFSEKLDQLNGENRYYFLGYFSEYFSSVATDDSNIAIEKLSSIAKNDRTNYVRIGAFMGLFGFIDQPGVLDLAKEIYAQEKDPLAKRYEEMFLSQYLDEK